jgi:hypothetical protein
MRLKVVALCSRLVQPSQEMLEMLIDNPAKAPLLQEGGGFAMIYGPDGAPLCHAHSWSNMVA